MLVVGGAVCFDLDENDSCECGVMWFGEVSMWCLCGAVYVCVCGVIWSVE